MTLLELLQTLRPELLVNIQALSLEVSFPFYPQAKLVTLGLAKTMFKLVEVYNCLKLRSIINGRFSIYLFAADYVII